MTTTATTASKAVHRIEVHPTAGDPVAQRIMHDAKALGIRMTGARSARVYLIEAELGDAGLGAVCSKLLADPVTERAVVGASDGSGTLIEVHPLPGVMDPAAGSVRDALHDLLGVDAEVTTGVRYEFEGISAGEAQNLARRLLANPVIQAIHAEPFHPDELPKGHEHESPLTHVPVRDLDDGALEKLSREAHLFLSLDEMRAIRDEYRRLEREPTTIELETIAQTWSEHCVHKTLKSRIVYREERHEGTEARRHEGAASLANNQSNDPACLRASVPVCLPLTFSNRPGHTINPDGSVTIDNLLKSTVAAATHELIAEGVDWTLSVFVDNAGVIAFDEDHAINVKVETHNHPSAIEPYGGAATGIGGCIRDVIGTGLGAKPIASTDVFCVAPPDTEDVPAGCLHPRRILSQVVAGVRDYGNRMGIPTVNGAVSFDHRYIGNPLVFCGSVGIMPRGENDCMITGAAQPGDRIIALGGRTGRDGIHGATFSSAELTDTHADEFSHAVQIGNAIEEKRVLDAILRARDYGVGRLEGTEARRHGGPDLVAGTQLDDPSCLRASVPSCLFNAITDCGAGGFSSAVGEMGEKLGAEVHLERAPLKYAGLTHTEIWISEAQERMVLAVPPENVAALQQICDEEHVELADLGHFGTPDRELILNHHGVVVGRLPMAFLHDGIPMPTREAVWGGRDGETDGERDEETKSRRDRVRASNDDAQSEDTSSLRLSVSASLRRLLSHPNIASKHWIIRQYDHEVQGNTVVRPLGGPAARGPMDAAVIEPVPGTGRGLAIACGLATGIGDPERGGDPYQMALAAIDECVRNLVCVGADPDRIAILDNFCWPSCRKPENLASLVRAAEGCYDGAKAYRTPFVSGKDSLNNQFTIPGEDGSDGRTIEIPPTLLITGVGIVPDISKCVTMDAKRAGNRIAIVEAAGPDSLCNMSRIGGSHLVDLTETPDDVESSAPLADLVEGPKLARFIAEAIRRGLVVSAHDASEGGPLVALAEMLIAGATPGAPLGATYVPCSPTPLVRHLGDRPHCYVLEIPPARVDEFNDLSLELGVMGTTWMGEITSTGLLDLHDETIPVEDLAKVWLGPLDW
ncbi:MAG: phosphoribosylformylglycinamidine synthase subunit PurS [Phycisphaeraceae bacterium]|nr:MAG: phosphoribosylformylglycinamidine synthase subunit PurS [Phycisphaeraceae bacterium]